MRQLADRDLLARGYAVTHPSGAVVLPTAAGWDQLLYASSGVMTVESDQGAWVVPPHRALWAPEGSRCRVRMHGRVAVRTLYLAAELGAQPGDLHAIDVPPLLRELVLHAVTTAPLRRSVPEHERLVGVVVDQLRTVPQAPLRLPFPSDPRARALADAFLSDPGSAAGIDELARRCGASRRTLERLFVANVGASIGAWRRRCRLVEALRLLAEGRPVTAVAHEVGYSTPSAFGAMFRAELGVAPRDYFA